MAFSLSSWFKGKPNAGESEDAPATTAPGGQTARGPSVPPPAPNGVPPGAVRTVLPTSTPQAQPPVSLRTPGAPTAPTARPPVTRNMSVRPPARKVSFPVPSAAKPVPAPATRPAPVSVAPPPPLPDAPNASVSLELGDFIDRLPPGYLTPGGFDRSRVVEFRATELYSDLAKGRASVPASTIYAKCPEIFARPVTDTEDVEVQLPLQKLVEQLSAAFRTRADQLAEDSVGEIETPFLQVAMEDNARLPTAAGTSAGAIRAVGGDGPVPADDNGLPLRPPHRTGQISTLSIKPVAESAPAPTLVPPSAPPINPGKRPPSTVRASVAGGKIRLSGPAAVARMIAAPTAPTVPPPAARPPVAANSTTQRIEVPRPPTAPSASPSHQVTKKTARIQIPPISLKPSGATGSAPRPPGTVPPPSIAVQASPVSIHPTAGGEPPVSFRASPPPPPSVKLPPPSFAPARPSFPPPAFPAMPPGAGAGGPPTGISVPPPAPATTDGRQIELGLAAVLRGQPASALAVEPEDVSDDVRFRLPFGPIERQLSTGRVSVPRQTFLDALPESHRHVLAEDDALTEVQIPLQEVFQNLPGNALTMRQDQVIEEITDAFPTPFRQKAQEDAERLGAVAPVAPPTPTVPEPAVEVEAAAPVEAASAATTEDTFAPAVEEETPTDLTPAPSDEPSLAADHETVVEDEAPRTDEPAHDIPLDLGEAPVTEIPREEPAAAQAEPAVAEPLADTPPSGAVVEPPMAADPTPVEEALAVLESTAPGEDGTPEEKPAAAGKPVPKKKKAPVRTEAPAPAPFEAVTLPETPEPAALPATRAVTAAAPQDTELQTVLMTEEELDAKGVVRHVCQLPGITGCAVMFADGLRLAGNFPDGDTEGFSAMAPPFFKRTSNFVIEAELGALQAITLHTAKGLLSFFMHQDICLSVSHTGRGFLPGVREKLEIVTRELARMYATEKPAESSGDHAL